MGEAAKDVAKFLKENPNFKPRKLTAKEKQDQMEQLKKRQNQE